MDKIVTGKAGNANLPIGDSLKKTNGNANLPIGDSLKKTNGNANLPIGDSLKTTNREIGVPGGANREIGSLGGHKGWHSRGYLPHYDSDVETQHVTFHLADSLPKEVLDRLKAELKTLPAAKRDMERRKRIEAWLDAGHGSCILRKPCIARMVEGSFQYFDAERYSLVAWVVMPNHVHVLFQPLNAWSVAKVVASWKKFTARKICDYFRSAGNFGNANLPIGGVRKTTNREIGVPGEAIRENDVPGPIWHREYWDRYMRNEEHFLQAFEYIHQNPVKAGLVAKAEDWPWSSARFKKSAENTANREIDDVGKDANREIGVPGEK